MLISGLYIHFLFVNSIDNTKIQEQTNPEWNESRNKQRRESPPPRQHERMRKYKSREVHAFKHLSLLNRWFKLAPETAPAWAGWSFLFMKAFW